MASHGSHETKKPRRTEQNRGYGQHAKNANRANGRKRVVQTEEKKERKQKT
jgi:hypothetical protein